MPRALSWGLLEVRMALSRDQLIRIIAAGSMLPALACNAPGNAVPAKPAEPFVPTLSLRPVSVNLATGATQTFQAEFNVPEGDRSKMPAIGWRVVEPEGGTVTIKGLYTAPATAGIYRVQVRREDFPEVMATATVTVK
jgi:hypothetical protein